MYTSSQVWELLVEGAQDIDELIDLESGLEKLSPPKRIFLILIGQEYTVKEAMGLAGIRGNQTRIKYEVLGELTARMNGERHGQEGLEE